MQITEYWTKMDKERVEEIGNEIIIEWLCTACGKLLGAFSPASSFEIVCPKCGVTTRIQGPVRIEIKQVQTPRYWR